MLCRPEREAESFIWVPGASLECILVNLYDNYHLRV